jgi:hypothetical protein
MAKSLLAIEVLCPLLAMLDIFRRFEASVSVHVFALFDAACFDDADRSSDMSSCS